MGSNRRTEIGPHPKRADSARDPTTLGRLEISKAAYALTRWLLHRPLGAFMLPLRYDDDSSALDSRANANAVLRLHNAVPTTVNPACVAMLVQLLFIAVGRALAMEDRCDSRFHASRRGRPGRVKTVSMR